MVVLTKADTHADPKEVVVAVEARAGGVDVVLTSSTLDSGVDEVAAHLRPNRTAVLLGPSGAGKSTLANRLLEAEVLATGRVRSGDHKGRHTTTSRDLVVVPAGGVLIDTPGVRSLTLLGAEEGLAAAFSDVGDLAEDCKFRDCRHDGEPGCAVAAAVDGGPARRRPGGQLPQDRARPRAPGGLGDRPGGGGQEGQDRPEGPAEVLQGVQTGQLTGVPSQKYQECLNISSNHCRARPRWPTRRFRGTCWLIVAARGGGDAPVARAYRPRGRRRLRTHSLLALVNSVRTESGLAPVVADASLASVASGWASSMASAGALSHNGSLTSSVTGWSKLGETVGRGASIEVVHGTFVSSPAHHAVMVDPAFTRVGFGVVHAADGRVYVVADFMQPSSAGAPRPAPASAPLRCRSGAAAPAAAAPGSGRSCL